MDGRCTICVSVTHRVRRLRSPPCASSSIARRLEELIWSDDLVECCAPLSLPDNVPGILVAKTQMRLHVPR